MGGGDGAGGPSADATGWDRRIHFEETVSATDNEQYNRLFGLARWLVLLFVLVNGLALVVMVSWGVSLFGPAVGGPDALLSLALSILSDLPRSVLAFLALCLLFAVGSTVMMVAAFWVGGPPTERVHTRITDEGVRLRWEGSPLWHFGRVGHSPAAWLTGSEELTVPFETVTRVEYADPDEPSLRVEFGDWRAKKYFAGRSTDWIRIVRSDGPTVYLGSNEPAALADRIASRAPGVERATPY